MILIRDLIIFSWQSIYLSRVEKLLSFIIHKIIINLNNSIVIYFKNFIFPFKFISIRKRYANISFKLILNDIYVTKLRSLKKFLLKYIERIDAL